MATINGTNLIIYIAGVAQGHAKECDLEISNAGRDITTKSSQGWKDNSADGLRSWKISGKGLVDFAGTGNASALFGYFSTRATLSAVLSAAGSKYYYGTVRVTSLKMSGPVEDNASYDFEMEGSGALTESAISPL